MSSPLGSSRPLIAPLYQSSVYTLPDLETLDQISDRKEPGFIYSRDGHPNGQELEASLVRLEAGSWGMVCSSGMASLSLGFLSLVQAGDRVVASNRLYGRSNNLLTRELARYGVTCEFVDVSDLGTVEDSLRKPARVLFVETISNPLLRVSDLSALANLCRQTGTKLFVDNTFASPVLCRPLEHGADLVMESLTKVVGGHHDLTLGFLCGTDADLQSRVAEVRSVWGFAANPFDCWLANRSLVTLPLRVDRSSRNALELARWLEEQPGVTRVIYPGLGSHPDFGLVGRLLPHGAGYVLTFELRGEGRRVVDQFFRDVNPIPFAPSLGGAQTTLSHPWTTSHRNESPEAKLSLGITETLMRLSVGIEPLELIRQWLSRGLAV